MTAIHPVDHFCSNVTEIKLSAKRVACSWHEIRWSISFSATNKAPPRWFHARCFWVETERLIRSHCCSQQFKLKLCTLRANTNWLVVLSMWSDLQSMLTPHQDEAPSKLNDTSSEVHLWSQPSWWGTPKLFNAPCGSAVCGGDGKVSSYCCSKAN